VAGVIKGGPVDNGTILAGDVIIKFDGKDIHEMRDLPRVVAESPVGKAVDVIIVRKGVEQTVKVTLGRLEDGEKLASGEDGTTDEDKGGDKAPAVSTASVLGMTVGELNDETRKKFSIAADVSGVVITDVAKDSAAAERGIQPGEVITEIAQESVATPKDVMDRIGALKEQGRKNALLMLGYKVRQAAIQIERRYETDLPTIQAYGTELQQVWTNLIDNAVDALEGSTPPRRLEVRAASDSGFVNVSLIDNGPGIPTEIQPRIFDPFFTTKAVGKGTGLGLEIVKRIINRHGGTIRVDSKPGETRFEIRLPIRQPTAPPVTAGQ